MWRWLGIQVPVGTTPQQVRDMEIQLLQQAFGIQGGVQTLALNEATVDTAPGLVQSASHVVVQVGSHTAQITALVTHLDGLATAYAYIEVAAAPTVDYEQLCAGPFVPIYFRLLISDNTDNLLDSDRDGVVDGLDRAPFDPTVP